MKNLFISLFLIITCTFSSNTFSAIYKCVSAQGQVIYNDKPCPNSNKESQIKEHYSSAVSIKPYTGRFRHNELVKRNIELIKEKSDSALKTTMDRLGIKRSIGVVDISVSDDNKVTNALAYASTVELYSVKRGIIVFDPRYMSFNGYNIEHVLIHEITHAVMRDILKERYSKEWPVWLKEGLSVWVSGELEERQRLTVSGIVFAKNRPAALINGIEGKHSGQDYYEDGLFFEYLEKEYGIKAIHKFIELAIKGNNYQTSFKLSFGSDLKHLQNKAREYSNNKLNRYLVKSDYNSYQKVKNLAAGRKTSTQKVKASYEEFINQYPNSDFIPNATYQTGIYNLRLKNYKEAIKIFDKMLANHYQNTNLFRNSLYHKGYSFMKMGEKKQAKKVFNKLLDTFPNTAYKKQIDQYVHEGLIPIY